MADDVTKRQSAALRFVVATVLEVAGLLGLAVGFGLLAVWLGVVVAGAGLLVLGMAVDPPARRVVER